MVARRFMRCEKFSTLCPVKFLLSFFFVFAWKSSTAVSFSIRNSSESLCVTQLDADRVFGPKKNCFIFIFTQIQLIHRTRWLTKNSEDLNHSVEKFDVISIDDRDRPRLELFSMNVRKPSTDFDRAWKAASIERESLAGFGMFWPRKLTIFLFCSSVSIHVYWRVNVFSLGFTWFVTLLSFDEMKTSIDRLNRVN